MTMVSNRVQELRWAKNWSLRQLSALSGVEHSLIGKIENHQRPNPSVETAIRLARAFDISAEELFIVD